MTPGRWAGLAAYLMLSFGLALTSAQIHHSWSNFPGWAGINLIVGGILVFSWIMPLLRKKEKRK